MLLYVFGRKQPSKIIETRVEKCIRMFGVFWGGGWGAASFRVPQKFL